MHPSGEEQKPLKHHQLMSRMEAFPLAQFNQTTPAPVNKQRKTLKFRTAGLFRHSAKPKSFTPSLPHFNF